MRRVAVFVDAGYFWVQVTHVIHKKKTARSQVVVDYHQMREELLAEIAQEFPGADLLRVYWYDGPGANGKDQCHLSIEDLDDFKLKLGTRNQVGDQKAVDGLIIADLIGLGQSKSITDAALVSGDADLTPGVQAAQGLGIRVHLLSLGPRTATSPYLRAEVDRKIHWDDGVVKKFVKAITPPIPPVPAGAAPAAPATAAAAGHVSAQAATPAVPAPVAAQTPAVPVSLQSTAKAFFDGMQDKTQLSKTGPVPPDIDRALLKAAKLALGRLLDEREKRDLRNELRKLI